MSLTKAISRIDANSRRPNHFIQVKMTEGSVIKDLYIQNWPAHGFSLNSCSDLTIQNIVMDNSAGDAPNAASGTKAAAHNSDGFGGKFIVLCRLEHSWKPAVLT